MPKKSLKLVFDSTNLKKENKPRIPTEIESFITQCCRIDPEKKATLQDLYKAFTYFAYKVGSYPELPHVTFGRKLGTYLTKNHPSIEHRKDPFNNYYVGIGLTEPIMREALKLKISNASQNADTADLRAPIFFDAFDTTEIREWAWDEDDLRMYTHVNILAETMADTKGYNHSAARIVSRQASLNAVAIKYDISIESAAELRGYLTHIALDRASNKLKVFNMAPEIMNLEDIDILAAVGLSILFAQGAAGVSSKGRVRINRLIRAVENMFQINYDDPQKWEGMNVEAH